MRKFILVLMVCSLFAKEEKYAELLAINVEMKPINIDLKIVMDKHNLPTEEIAIYFSDGYYKFAIYLNKEQRQEMVELYNKYEKWKLVAYENKVSHNKELGKIKKIKAYFYISEWYAATNVLVKLVASVGNLNAIALMFPKFQSITNEYIEGDPPILSFMETSEMNTVMNNTIENLGVTSPKQFIFDNLDETNLLEIRKKILEEEKKKKNVDSLFE